MKKYLVCTLILLVFTTLYFPPQPLFAVETVLKQKELTTFNGNRLLVPIDKTTVLTDGSPTATYTFWTLYITDVVVDVTTDKGLNLTITPLPDVDDLAFEGAASTPLYVVAGVKGRGIYSKIGAPNTKVTVTKTEAGSTTTFELTIRGLQK